MLTSKKDLRLNLPLQLEALSCSLSVKHWEILGWQRDDTVALVLPPDSVVSECSDAEICNGLELVDLDCTHLLHDHIHEGRTNLPAFSPRMRSRADSLQFSKVTCGRHHP